MKDIVLPEPVRLFQELAKPDKVVIVWWEPMDVRETYFRVKTTRHTWLVKQNGSEIRCWRTENED